MTDEDQECVNALRIAELDKRLTFKVDELKTVLDLHVMYQMRAVEKAALELDHWKASANEWRQAMTEKDRNFVTKNALWGYFIGMIGLILAIVALFLKAFSQ